MQTLEQAQTSPDYTTDCELVDVNAIRVKYKVANASVFVQLMPRNPFGGEEPWSQEFLVTPEDNACDDTIGIRFRDAIANEHAQVVAQSFAEGDPAPGIGLSFTSQVGAGGKFNTGGQMITGIVAANGAVTAGSGYSVNHTGTGIYVITFNVPFTNAPVVLATSLSPSAGSTRPLAVQGVTTSACTIKTEPTSTPADIPFNFIAQAVE